MKRVSLPLLLLLGACSARRNAGDGAHAPSAAPTLASLPAAWTRIAGGAGTDCALGTPFWFYVHPGNPRRLMIFLEGGGACWTGETCDVEGHPTFNATLDSTADPGRRMGVFNLTSPENPVRDYTMVLIPYCTGDVHLGTRTVSYTSGSDSHAPGRTFQIHHVGAVNATAALSWTFANVKNPEMVFVTGSSAGAVASPVFAAKAAAHYRQARVVQLGDAGGAYRGPSLGGILARLGIIGFLHRDAAFRALDSTNTTETAIYAAAARAFPRVSFSEYNAVDDSVQLGFQHLLGVRDRPLRDALAPNIAEIRAAVPQFRSYTAPGFVHTILSRPRLFTLSVDSVRFVDWLGALIDGKPARNVGDRLLSPP